MDSLFSSAFYLENRRLKQKAETKAEMEDLLEETRNDAKKESRFREV